MRSGRPCAGAEAGEKAIATIAIRHDDLKRQNRARVIGEVRRTHRISRTELAAATGLSHSTISTIASDLIGEGILSQNRDATASVRRGRPQVGLTLAPAAGAAMAVVLTLNTLSATVFDYAAQVVSHGERRLDAPRLSRDDLIGQCLDIVRARLAARQPAALPVLRIVLAVQGVTDSHARTMLWSPITPHDDIGFADMLEAEFGIPATVENECNMMAEALRWRNPQQYRKDFLAVLLSHGIGMGLMLGGAMFTGLRSSGGEFGHMVLRPAGALCRCGRRGCIEAYASDYAIWRNARGPGGQEQVPSDVSGEEMDWLARMARQQDGPERDAFRTAGEALGFGIGNLFALIDPVPVAMIGSGARAFDLIEPALREALAKTAGGHHAQSVIFEAIADEYPLIRQGCVMRALTFIDEALFAPGIQPDGQSSRIA